MKSSIYLRFWLYMSPLDSYLSLYFLIVQHNNKITIWKMNMLKSERIIIKERCSCIDLRRQLYLFKSNMENKIITISGIIVIHSQKESSVLDAYCRTSRKQQLKHPLCKTLQKVLKKVTNKLVSWSVMVPINSKKVMVKKHGI